MPAQPQMPAWVARGPMLPTAGPPPEGPGWAVEIKWDGMRALVVAGPEGVQVSSRSGREVSSSFPEIRALAHVIGSRSVVLDGEIVAIGAGGQPNFVRLQNRIQRTRLTTALLRDVVTLNAKRPTRARLRPCS
ncbi:hypothetical protein [Saccharopolyspora spinosa]|uniref:Bifunctional non-homologous end joining protein LigD n=2 Tax=Saccharopolyspora spinosa TaxID=60894 RepID=A0A2N3Y1Q3_SACSN|nr:hypothetical protein [Saccharopolyspora spinosa]PKW16847.1 bifunctional non-homologous end joining protein LigD [Saccharopolyspora spinosa]